MSRDWNPLTLHYFDKQIDFRKQKATWHIEGKDYPTTYMDELSEVEKQYVDKCPELIFLARGVLPMLKDNGVSDDFLIKVEETIKSIEEAYDKASDGRRDLDIPDRDTEPMKTLLKWWTNNSYRQEVAKETLCNELITLSDIERQAKQNVTDYLEDMYDTIYEIR